MKSKAIAQIPGWSFCSLFNSLHNLLDILPLGFSPLSPLRHVTSANAGVFTPSHLTTFNDLVDCDLPSFISSCFPSLVYGCYYLLPFPPPGRKLLFQLISQQDVSLIPFVPLLLHSCLGLCFLIEDCPFPMNMMGAVTMKGRTGTSSRGNWHICGPKRWGLEKGERSEKLGEVLTLQRHSRQLSDKP